VHCDEWEEDLIVWQTGAGGWGGGCRIGRVTYRDNRHRRRHIYRPLLAGSEGSPFAPVSTIRVLRTDTSIYEQLPPIPHHSLRLIDYRCASSTVLCGQGDAGSISLFPFTRLMAGYEYYAAYSLPYQHKYEYTYYTYCSAQYRYEYRYRDTKAVIRVLYSSPFITKKDPPDQSILLCHFVTRFSYLYRKSHMARTGRYK
jgi:hypothetical protein